MKELLDKIQLERDIIDNIYLTPTYNPKLMLFNYLWKVNNQYDFFYETINNTNPYIKINSLYHTRETSKDTHNNQIMNTCYKSNMKTCEKNNKLQSIYKNISDKVLKEISDNDFKKVQESELSIKNRENELLSKIFENNFGKNGQMVCKSTDRKIENPFGKIENPFCKIENPFCKIENPFGKIENPFGKIEKPYENIPITNIKVNIQSVYNLLELIENYPINEKTKYNINMQAIHNIKEPLVKLDSMVGMKNLKTSIVDQILYFVQNLHQNDSNDNDFMHTVIYGPPGTGKTEIANIMGQIFAKLGVLKKNIFKKATRTELIAGFLGQTALKTNDLIKSCLGGCLFIDEAYALGNREKRDSFAKECIDTLCEALSFHKNDLMVIIAGYEKDLKDCFFSYNSGLESRFTWRFNTDDYTASELNLIFQKKIKDIGWTLKEEIKDEWFEKNMDYFKYYGRDMETLLAKTKIAHSRRVFCLPLDEKKKIDKDDLVNGFKMFLSNDEVKKRKDVHFVSEMYI